MLVVGLGALLVLGGLLFMIYQPIWRGRLSDARRISSAVARDTLEPHTLEPRMPGAGFGLKANWPGIVLFVLGGILLLVGGASYSVLSPTYESQTLYMAPPSQR